MWIIMSLCLITTDALSVSFRWSFDARFPNFTALNHRRSCLLSVFSFNLVTCLFQIVFIMKVTMHPGCRYLLLFQIVFFVLQETDTRPTFLWICTNYIKNNVQNILSDFLSMMVASANTTLWGFRGTVIKPYAAGL